ncbi:carbonic anhydrase [Labrenzia sp. 011]|uniref:carbonic anhydrase n=1 Tax=Labrenzia sp. 011 TaxID=2171494 RepID=UPI000D51EB20|nr:carbonic anhydrase [Labrenzia sp. 011]PVB62325.1 carbonic anhydrase [Labrenzia sp. 011]
MCEDCNAKTVSRRGLIAGGLALSLATPLATQAFAQETSAVAPASPEEALQRLIDGNARYVANAAINTDHSLTRASRAEGQQPFAAIVSCSDSRVAPELIFDQGPGELFVVRVAGNFISEEGLATLEYGVAVLGIKTIVVLGHTSCGAVDATIKSIADRELPPGHLPSLVNAIRPAVYDVMDESPDDLLAAATAQNARLNAARALSEGPILSEAAAAGKLDAVAGMYEIATGKVSFL